MPALRVCTTFSFGHVAEVVRLALALRIQRHEEVDVADGVGRGPVRGPDHHLQLGVEARQILERLGGGHIGYTDRRHRPSLNGTRDEDGRRLRPVGQTGRMTGRRSAPTADGADGRCWPCSRSRSRFSRLSPPAPAAAARPPDRTGHPSRATRSSRIRLPRWPPVRAVIAPSAAPAPTPGGTSAPSSSPSGTPSAVDPAVVASNLTAPIGIAVLPDGTALVGQRTTGVDRAGPGDGRPAGRECSDHPGPRRQR